MSEKSSFLITMSGFIPPPSFTSLPFLVVKIEIKESGNLPTLPSSFLFE